MALNDLTRLELDCNVRQKPIRLNSAFGAVAPVAIDVIIEDAHRLLSAVETRDATEAFKTFLQLTE